MPSGLAALLDDIATIAKVASASIDDVAAAAGKASSKAAGVVIDDTAVTPQYVTGFTPDRELPIIWRIAKGSLFNKIVIILPVALLLSFFLPQAITPLLMAGGAFLCFEGAEKVLEKLMPHEQETLAEELAEVCDKTHEETMVKGAVRTDFILSAEIMAIALNEVKGLAETSIWLEAGVLVVVAIGITIAVYGKARKWRIAGDWPWSRQGHAETDVPPLDHRHRCDALGRWADHRPWLWPASRRLGGPARRCRCMDCRRDDFGRHRPCHRRGDCRHPPYVGGAQKGLGHQHGIFGRR